ncbi:MAG: hypothetical protein CVU56_23985 [Deltaproteobacteria bacterium HGW-Deltaproteobacteria-14]|nr:MAG: hypothetical protein CVU56_23985 [Deltaproteobacteria bacterium HGW-Deltaproteobacteria-14]
MIQSPSGALALALALALLGVAPGCDSPPDFTGDPCEIAPTLTSLQAQSFKPGCSFDGCHDQRSSEGGLDFESPGLHARLVNVAAMDDNAGARGKLRVVPGDPDASFLVQKVEGTQAGDEGELMPEGADAPISPECRIAQLRRWIEDGAKDN